MKSAKEIISHIKSNPSSPYNRSLERKKFTNFIFSPIHRKLVSFVYIKNEILMIALKHPSGLQELKNDSNINLIKYLLKKFANFFPNSEFANIKDIKFFISNQSYKKEKFINFEPEKPKIYIEKSLGKFKNDIKDEKIHAIFEEIREIILANKRD